MARHHVYLLFRGVRELLSLLKPQLAWFISWTFLIWFDMSLLYANPI